MHLKRLTSCYRLHEHQTAQGLATGSGGADCPNAAAAQWYASPAAMSTSWHRGELTGLQVEDRAVIFSVVPPLPPLHAAVLAWFHQHWITSG
jgi:hypothetical protein